MKINKDKKHFDFLLLVDKKILCLLQNLQKVLESKLAEKLVIFVNDEYTRHLKLRC